MSDFLTRLVQRQIGKIPSIEARVPALYASVPAAMPLAITEEIPPQPSDSRPSVHAPAAVDDANPTQNLTAAIVEIRQWESAPVANAPQGKLSQPGTEPGPRVSIDNASSEVAPPARPPSKLLPNSAASSPPDPISEQRVLASTLVAVPALQLSFAGTWETPLASPEQVRPISAPPRLEVKESGRGEVGARERAHAGSEPYVQVTIGRIEVTALTQAVPAKQAPAQRKPAMSLEDYLARRQRGER
jgi:hypothetical protein